MATIDQQFVEYIVKTLVNNPDKVAVERKIDEKGVLLSLTSSGFIIFFEHICELCAVGGFT